MNDVEQYVSVEEDGRLLADARLTPDTAGGVQATMHVESGQLPQRTRARLVDAVLDSHSVEPGSRLHVTMPAGDGEILDRVKERCDDVESRGAGTSCLVDATVPSADASVG